MWSKFSKWLERGDERFLSVARDPERREKHLIWLRRSRSLFVLLLLVSTVMFVAIYVIELFFAWGASTSLLMLVLAISCGLTYNEINAEIKMMKLAILIQPKISEANAETNLQVTPET
jgi:hypothetical protein